MNIREYTFTPKSVQNWKSFLADHSFGKEELLWLYCTLPEMEWLTDPEHLPELTECFLHHGMDPNMLVTEDVVEDNPDKNVYLNPLIACLQYWDDGGPMDALKVLLDHGANPNFEYRIEPYETPFAFYDDCPYIHGEDMDLCEFHGLILCAAYGGLCADGKSSFEMLRGESIAIFRDYRKYGFEYEGYKMYVIDLATKERVARYRW